MKARASMKLIGSAAAALLLFFTAPSVLAGSVTQPGDTMGTPSGAQTPPGFIFTNQANTGCRDTSPRTCVWTEVPLIAWSTPWKVLGGNLLFAAGPTTWVDVDINDTYEASGWFNPFVGAKLAWDLGNGWGFGYLLGGYINADSDVAYSSSSLNQRFGLSYTGNGWNLTANVIWGVNFDEVTNDPQGFPCPTLPELGCNPNFINVDFTGTKRFGNWELGPIGYYATDISTPIDDYRKQRAAAIGGLVGYSFDRVIVQIYATTEFYEENYGGKDTRLWSRLTIPLGNAPPPPKFRPFGL